MNTFETIEQSFDDVEWCKECKGFEFKSRYPQFPCICNVLVVLRKSDGVACVVCSERSDNYGRSISQGVMDIRELLVSTLNLQAPLLWLEHYPHGTVNFLDKYTIRQVYFYPGMAGRNHRLSWWAAGELCGLAPELLARGYHDEL